MTESINSVGSSTFFSAGVDPHALSPESMMVYLQSRISGLDQQIDSIFGKQEKDEKVRSALAEIQRQVGSLDEKAENKELVPGTPEVAGTEEAIRAQIALIEDVYPDLAVKITTTLEADGGVLSRGDSIYNGSEVVATKQYLANVGKDLENSAQMNMIRLQSLMSSRQTAVQLATNIIASYAESQKGICSNIR